MALFLYIFVGVVLESRKTTTLTRETSTAPTSTRAHIHAHHTRTHPKQLQTLPCFWSQTLVIVALPVFIYGLQWTKQNVLSFYPTKDNNQYRMARNHSRVFHTCTYRPLLRRVILYRYVHIYTLFYQYPEKLHLNHTRTKCTIYRPTACTGVPLAMPARCTPAPGPGWKVTSRPERMAS